MARTAVVAGTATAVSNRVSRRQASRWGAQEEYAPEPAAPPPPAAPAPPAENARLEQLQNLAQLKEQGVLTDAEFAAEKARILQGS
jgi:hypothetical protein